MKLVLRPELEHYIDQQVKAGRYESPEEVVAAALTRQIQDERMGEFLPGELDALLAEGERDIEKGATVTLDEAREHFQRRKDEAAGK
jgi:putative addiction module CopG family antidote